jgi:uncharacterized membrane protein HdeD (DUF308 family)
MLVFGVAMLGMPQRGLDAAIAALGLYLLVVGAIQVVRAVEEWRSRATASD